MGPKLSPLHPDQKRERRDGGEGVGWVTLERIACTQGPQGKGSENTSIPRSKGRKKDNQGGVTCPALAMPTFIAPGHTPLWHLPMEKGSSSVNHAEGHWSSYQLHCERIPLSVPLYI